MDLAMYPAAGERPVLVSTSASLLLFSVPSNFLMYGNVLIATWWESSVEKLCCVHQLGCIVSVVKHGCI